MDVAEVLVHILIVLLAAKAAAEVSERVGVPPVVGEILAGILVGPSVLGIVGQDDVLRVLGELGVILLLLEVGMEMDLGELRSVGRASLSVATIGVVVPFVAGLGVGTAYGMDTNEALFVAAALTATSVGITARVFGDLRALASVEARTVLGAAVADDVMGLVILTVVTRVVSEGTISLVSLAWIVIVAVGFLVVVTVVGVRLVPPLFAFVTRHSRSAGTLVAVALAFTLAIAELADAGPAGADRRCVRRRPRPRPQCAGGAHPPRAQPVGHLLIPVFFLQIGIDAEVGPLRRALRARHGGGTARGRRGRQTGLGGRHAGAPGDRLLVGIGMVPRGEVGLIFATIGLRQAVFGDDVYAALLLVVLATTLITPPFLRARLLHLRAARQPARAAPSVAPLEGWVRVSDDVVELVAEPPAGLTLEVALEVALACADARPGASVLDWLAAIPPGPLHWTRGARRPFFDLLERGTPRSWRLLAMGGVVERALPELGTALARRQHEFEFDPLAALQLPWLRRLQTAGRYRTAENPERVLLAALVLSVATPEDRPVVVARKVVQRLDLGAAAEQSVARLVADADLFTGAARRLDGLDEESVLQLAAHIGSLDQARSLYSLSLAAEEAGDADRRRLDALYELVAAALAHPELVGREASNTVEQRRAEAIRLVGANRDARERLEAAPRAYLLATAPADLARQVAGCDPLPRYDTVRTAVTPLAGETAVWWIDVVARDRPGLLARQTGVLASAGIDVIGAISATWGDGCGLSSFLVQSARSPSEPRLAADFEAALGRPLEAQPMDGVTLEFDDVGSPWHTVCTARARDQRGLLHAVTTAFAAAGANVHAARVRTDGDAVVDVFELTDGKDAKLAPAIQDKVRELLAGGATGRRRRARRRTASPLGDRRTAIDPLRP